MSLEQQVSELTAALRELTAQLKHGGASQAAAPAKAKAAKPEPAAEAKAAAPAPEPAPKAAASAEEPIDRDKVRELLVEVQAKVSRERAIDILENIGHAKTVGKVAEKDYAAIVTACRAALEGAE
jgi:pyruvate/2-oxoglutarate dehydrogenase complex dihydrolipoamide acyltransferase (E2) component